MLTHQGTKTLRTNRLTLRRFTVEDANLMFENWANDTRVTRYLTWPAHTSPVFTKQLLESWCAEYEKPDFYNWAICLDNHPIGNISAVEISERDESAALGYCIGTAYWRKGIMPEESYDTRVLDIAPNGGLVVDTAEGEKIVTSGEVVHIR